MALKTGEEAARTALCALCSFASTVEIRVTSEKRDSSIIFSRRPMEADWDEVITCLWAAETSVSSGDNSTSQKSVMAPLGRRSETWMLSAKTEMKFVKPIRGLIGLNGTRDWQ